MRAVELVARKRDGAALSREEIELLIRGYVGGEIPDYQMAALAMAVFFRGMSPEETGHLTRAMIDSGEVYDLSDLPGPRVDKHSTGGVGDKVSLVLAPLAASLGVTVPMMSGRALGHTGGTLDKLESIPGYRTDLSLVEFREGLRKVGFAMIGQSERIVPADRKLYALRDVTATVESIPLITASILSKKFAEGADALVFDVKAGSGAFMKSFEDAERLAESLVRTGESLGRRVKAVISDMDQPLGRMVGNFLEVREVIDCLQGRGPPDLMDLTLRLTAWMLVLGGLAPDIERAEQACREKIRDGSAWRKFLDNVRFQGGQTEVLEDPQRGPRAAIVRPLRADREGIVERVGALQVGLASRLLGAGRLRREDPVRPEVGVELVRVAGEPVGRGEEIGRIHGADETRVGEAEKLLSDAWSIAAPARPAARRRRTASRVWKEL
jgi:pyrimidine-nucleoside phosphorylase